MPCPNCRCPSCFALVGSPIPSTGSSLPPPELLMANCAPTNSEVAYSRDVISSSEKMVSLIEATIDDLEKRKTELSGLISTHKAAISPLRSFPPEILAEIFSQFVDMVEGHWNSMLSPPLMLMRICSWWRRIVVDTPQLWTKILSPHPIIDSWITRSKDLPLHLQLDLSRPTSYPTLEALEALIPHSHRWEHVDFCFGPESIPFLTRVKTRLHSLKQLNLSLSDTRSRIIDFCEVAPQLTHIRLMGFCNVIVKLPWEQLRVCTLDNSELALYVLQHAKNLQTFHLDMSEVLELLHRSGGPPPCPCHLGLDTLITHWSPVEFDINLLFSSLTLPSLQTLEIHFDFFDYRCDESDADTAAGFDAERAELESTLVAFFERSCAHLNTLTITGIPFSPSILIKCLSFAPSLISLDIQFDSRWFKIDGQLLRSLRLNVNHPTDILPRLRSLALREPVGMFIEIPLDTLIASRRHINPEHAGVAMLENLTLECPLIWLESGTPRFHRFVSEGLNITYGKYGNEWPIYNSTQADSSLEERV